jgi:hypothetical protein
MSTSIRPTQVGEVKPNTSYGPDEVARQFWRLSFRTGRDYIRGRDASGLPVMIQHEREEAVSYQRRLRTTKPRNFVGTILRRYNDLVFRKTPQRDEQADELFLELVADADGKGTSLDQFMKDALLLAQIERETYIVPDVLRAVSDSGRSTAAAIKEAGTRPILVRIGASSVVNWTTCGQSLSEILTLWDGEGGKVLRWWGETERQDFAIDQGSIETGVIKITGIEAPVKHGYERMPVVRLKPNFDPMGQINASDGDSQAGPLAESQQAIVNLLSLLNEEITNVTFSQMIAMGVSEEQVSDVQVGNTRVLCLPNPAAKMEMIGADPAQADSIRASVTDEKDNLLAQAGIVNNGAQAAESGLALAFRHNDLVTIVSALAISCEQAENQLAVELAEAWGVDDPGKAVYSGKDADLPDFAAEAKSMIDFVSNAALPPVLRRKVAERFATRNLPLDDDEKEELRQSFGQQATRTAGLESGNPFPNLDPADVGAVERATTEAPVEKVQDTALNGAQIASLVELLSAVSAGTLAPEAAILAITNAFPTIDETEARKMVAAQAAIEAEDKDDPGEVETNPKPGVKPDAEALSAKAEEAQE